MIDPWYLDHLVCPVDRTPLNLDGEVLLSAAGRRYPILDGIPVMLVDQVEQNLWVAQASLSKANRAEGMNLDPLYLDTVGVDEDERVGIKSAISRGGNAIDPVVSYIISHTCGIAYKHLVGNLCAYPIPEIRLAEGNGRSLLDLGCNWGRWSIAAARRGYQVVGLDPSLGAILAARRVARSLNLEIRHVVGDARFLPFREGTFDTVFSYSVLQHFPKADARQTLQAAGLVLKECGDCLIQMPNFLGVRCLQHQLRRRFREAEGFEVRYWSVPELSQAFEAGIGPSKVTVDCFFGLGLQKTDMPIMPRYLKVITQVSEVLRGISHFFSPLKYLADSVYIHSKKIKSTLKPC